MTGTLTIGLTHIYSESHGLRSLFPELKIKSRKWNLQLQMLPSWRGPYQALWILLQDMQHKQCHYACISFLALLLSSYPFRQQQIRIMMMTLPGRLLSATAHQYHSGFQQSRPGNRLLAYSQSLLGAAVHSSKRRC